MLGGIAVYLLDYNNNKNDDDDDDDDDDVEKTMIMIY